MFIFKCVFVYVDRYHFVIYESECMACICRVTRLSWFYILNLTFVAKGRHSSLWPEATTFEKSQRAY